MSYVVHLRPSRRRPARRSWPARTGRAGARESVRAGSPRTPSALAYSVKKYQTFHSGSSTWRTASRIAASVTGMSPPRSTGERHQHPAHRVRAVRVEHLVHVGVVAQALGHLAAVVAQQDAVAHAVAERRPVEQRRGQHVHGVEPAAGLPDVLDDEVARVVVLEPVACSRTGSAPGRTASTRTRTSSPAPPAPGASSTCPVGSSGLGRVSSSTHGRCRSVTVDAEVALQLVERAVDVDPRVVRVVGLPHRDRRAPEPVAADRPVAGVGQPLAERAVLDVRRASR